MDKLLPCKKLYNLIIITYKRKRQRLIDRFNDKTTDIKIFLLCGKAGGTGLNLTGTA